MVEMVICNMWLIYLFFILVAVVADESYCNSNTDKINDGSCSSNNIAVVIKWIDELPTESMYIDGEWVKPTSSTDDSSPDINVTNPSTGQTITKVSVATKSDVDTAVNTARQALTNWSIDTTLTERRDLAYKLLQLYNKNSEQMAQLISHEMGAPIDLSRSAQVTSGSFVIEQFLHEIDKGSFESEYELDDTTTIYNEAIGVVALITPWNWPMNQIALKVIPALLVGCTVILKPSEQTPLSALLFATLIHDAGFPKGVFQLVNGYGSNHVGEWLASHKDIDMISFTGSTRGGREVTLAAASTLKRVSLEMGGKGANIIFDDIIQDGDMDEFKSIIEDGVWNVMSNSGQTCNAPTRMLVPEEYWDHALKIAKEEVESIQVGSAHVEGDDHIGPVVSETQYNRIQEYIQSGIDEGATLLIGGLGKPQISENDDDSHQLQEHYETGYYVQPTIFTDCKPNMKIWKEEIFGPVLCLTKYSSEEEAITLANDSKYGLTNYVHTYDKERQLRLARKLESGMIEFNSVSLSGSAPFGGVKLSGNSREGGVWGLEDFCIVKSVSGLE